MKIANCRTSIESDTLLNEQVYSYFSTSAGEYEEYQCIQGNEKVL
jgi:hypothetical protein